LAAATPSFSNGSEPDRVYGEIKEFGPGTWMRIQSMAEPESADRRQIRALTPAPSASVLPAKEPVRRDTPLRVWCNLAKLAAVVLPEEPSEAATTPDAPSFPKVGIPYYLNSKFGPWFGKVMETKGEGWFRLHEKSPRAVGDTDRSVHWWINLSFLTQLTEGKPDDWPD